MAGVRAVIFDLYGTLLDMPRDSRPYHKLASLLDDGSVMDALDRALTRDLPTLADFAADTGIRPPDNIEAMQRELDADVDDVRLFDDVMPTLAALRDRGIEMAVISNLATPYSWPCYDHGLGHLIETYVYSYACGMVKPDAGIHRLALERLGMTPEETVMVGDSYRADVDGPQQVGVRGVHLVRSGGESPAECVIDSLEAIVDLLG